MKTLIFVYFFSFFFIQTLFTQNDILTNETLLSNTSSADIYS
ncbi:MAG: hypothetical protein UZ05_CHB002001675, partial [Chlorobi bacterium OLB5]